MGVIQGLQFDCLKNFSAPVTTKKKLITCILHGDYESDVDIYENGDEVIKNECPVCRKIRLDKELEQAKKRQTEENINLCKECNVEPEFYLKTLDDYIPTSESEKKAKESVEKLINGELKKVILLGGTGTGKTLLGSIAAKTLKGKILTMYEISTMIRQSYTVKADKTELEIVRELASIPFLAIDEVGRTKGSQAEFNWLSYVLDKRHVRGLPFMLMSNGHIRSECKNNGCDKCFENYMDVDVISRLRQNSKLININAKDYRSSN